jgi:dienelactone hydrolase
VRRLLTWGLPAALCAALLAPSTAAAFDPSAELLNFSKITERERYVTLTPDFLTLLLTQTATAPLETLNQLATDPERLPANVCGIRSFECAGDVRFYDWGKRTGGIQQPVLFTARSGATISGTVWASKDGPANRPGIVITTGSVQAPEELYWGQAATLAKHGYVVLTYDVQGQGRSDLLGEGGDALEGFPGQTTGEPFYDGTEDALDFLTSTPAHPYEPRNSCSTNTSHAAKQDRRVAAGLDAAYDPAHDLLDPSRIGIAGHSLGAGAVSYVGQEDPRVDGIVAWDNLGRPDQGAEVSGGVLSVPPCASAPATRTPKPITKPAMGISNDYGIVPLPFSYGTTSLPSTADPDPQDKNAAFLAYRAANVDSAEMTIRGGCHEESAFIPGSFTGAYPLGCGTLRGSDLIAWYTTAWFDKYVKGNPAADTRLLSDRWRSDSKEAAIDPSGDGNAFSFYFRSRFDVGLAGGGRAVCDDMRAGCPSMAGDGLPADYSFVDDSYGAADPPQGAGAASASQVAAAKKTRKCLRKAKKHGKKRKRCIKRGAKRR